MTNNCTTSTCTDISVANETRAAEHASDRPLFKPKADVYETKDAIILLADMPGVDENSVDITLEKNSLTIKGTVNPSVPEGHSLTYAEFGSGDFQRQFVLSDEVDREGITASVKNGVLKMTLPKSRIAQAKKIAVRGDSIPTSQPALRN